MDLVSGRNERLLPGFLVRHYHVSKDGKYVVFDTLDNSDRSRIWVAAIDRSQPPRQLTPEGEIEEQRPFFGASGDIFFMQERAQNRFLYRMKTDGSAREQVSATPITFLVNISPDEEWAVLWDADLGAFFLPLAGGKPRLLCLCGAGPIVQDSPRVSWSGNGRWLYVNGDARNSGTTLIPWRGAETLRAVELARNSLASVSGARRLPETGTAPGPIDTRYAFARRAEQSNLYRIRLKLN